MSRLLPPNRPMQPRALTAAVLAEAGVHHAVALLAKRAYFLDTMGQPGVNDRGIYDDAIILLGPNVYATFNANTDPSIFRPGIASLEPGLYSYKVGVHGLSKPASQRYTALVQAGPVTVRRDSQGLDTGMFGINIHRGSYSGTSSLGCQTIFPDQWPGFIALVQEQLKRAGQKTIPYLLV